LGELAREARLHFQREEEVMRTDEYPDFDDHKADHDLLLAELSVLARELHDAGAQHLDEAGLDTLKDWLLGHVLDFDRRLADFLKNPGQTEPAPVSSD
jgi:hemerythrin